MTTSVAKNKLSNRLFVGSLPWSVTSEELGTLFSRIGNVVDAVVLKDKISGKSKGYGFVEMETSDQAVAAMNKFNGYELKGRTIVVNLADPKQPKTLFM